MSKLESTEYTKAVAAELFRNEKETLDFDNTFPDTTSRRRLKLAAVANGASAAEARIIDTMSREDIERTRQEFHAPHVRHPAEERRKNLSDPLTNQILHLIAEKATKLVDKGPVATPEKMADSWRRNGLA